MGTQQDKAASIFEAVVELGTAAERAAHLDAACGQDPQLRAEVEELLAHDDAAGSFLNLSGRPDPQATTDEPSGSDRAGMVIGPYKLLEQIGEGGFGLVFMAEQHEPIRRKVAVKILKPGMDSKQVIARFEVERQALALMDHPNIAKVLDAGQTSSGRPYFVMDLVKGLPLTEFCDQSQFTPKERLELFVSVCQAVQHAHQKGIIHRDLKPSNVLVTLQDGKALVKVIDFGIAKAVGQQLTDKTLFTGFAQMIGTPLYMSPEQAALSNVDVDTRSDIYSLGVLLYELLTGTTPFDKERLQQAGYDELRRIIREEEPPRPSTRISTLGQAATTVSTQRKSDPRRLSRLFRGELDWIVMKALEKDRDRRYESAGAFAADVQRYLDDEPVLACPPSAWYRFRKFARRNKTGLAVAGLILFFIAVLGGGGGWVVRDRAARQQRLTTQVELILDDVGRLEQEQKWPEALAAAERAEAALAGGEAADAIRRRVHEVRRNLAFVARLERIRQDRAQVIEGKYNDRGTAEEYGRAFRDYGVDVEGLPADEAVAQLQARRAPAVPVAAALEDWVVVRRRRQRRGEDAPNWKGLMAVARGIDGDPLRDRLRAVWGRQVSPELQAELRQLAESIDFKAHRPATLVTLAWALLDMRLADSAVQVLRDGQHTYPSDLWLNLDLGLQLFNRKDFAQAVRYFEAVVAIRPDVAAGHANLGAALYRVKDLKGAIRECRVALQIDPKNARAHCNLGTSLFGTKNLKGAIREYRAALQIDPDYALAHCNLGVALYATKDLEGAIRELRAALHLDANIAYAHNGLGLALKDKKDLKGAIREFHAALEIERNYADAHHNLGLALHDKKDLEGAIREFRAAVTIDPHSANAHISLGAALLAKNDLEGCIRECRAALAIEPNDVKAHYNLGKALSSQNDLAGAIREYREVLAINPGIAEAHCNLGNVLLRLGQLGEALGELRRGHEVGSRMPGWPYPSAQWVRQCERLVELDGKLPGFLAGKAMPASAGERIELAELCSLKRLNRAAARFYEEAFTVGPQLADDLSAAHRYNAACAAALAGCGVGKDADKLDEKERARLRGQALGWLRADLEALRLLLKKGANKAGPPVLTQLRQWLADPDLAGVRGMEAIAHLREAERQEWRKLWDDVFDALKRAAGKPRPEKQTNAT
jgi:serine/threonine protein kinase/Flp pilus assembly protein TadD